MWRCGILLVVPQSGVSAFCPGDALIVLLFVFLAPYPAGHSNSCKVYFAWEVPSGWFLDLKIREDYRAS
jgi:hypothetical protein